MFSKNNLNEAIIFTVLNFTLSCIVFIIVCTISFEKYTYNYLLLVLVLQILYLFQVLKLLLTYNDESNNQWRQRGGRQADDRHAGECQN